MPLRLPGHHRGGHPEPVASPAGLDAPPASASVVRPLPSSLPREELQRLLDVAPDWGWFYEFTFTNRASTKAADAVALAIHDVRAELIFPLLDRMFESRWPEARCLDIACHQGWFSAQLAARGAAEVIGFDIRPEHVAVARQIADLGGFTQMRPAVEDFTSISPERHGTFDIVLFLGLLYHLEDPVGALRRVRALTRDVCVIETQVAQGNQPISTEWGSGAPRSGPPIALIPADVNHHAGGGGVVLVPSLDALYELVRNAGFSSMYLSVAGRGAPEQYQNADRVVVFAFS